MFLLNRQAYEQGGDRVIFVVRADYLVTKPHWAGEQRALQIEGYFKANNSCEAARPKFSSRCNSRLLCDAPNEDLIHGYEGSGQQVRWQAAHGRGPAGLREQMKMLNSRLQVSTIIQVRPYARERLLWDFEIYCE